MTVQNQPPAETSEAPVQEPSHSACPHPGCKGNGDDIRHVMVHTMDCRVAGCHLGNPVFPSVRALGAHLIREHNRNDMTVCHWPGCASAGRRARNNHLGEFEPLLCPLATSVSKYFGLADFESI